MNCAALAERKEHQLIEDHSTLNLLFKTVTRMFGQNEVRNDIKTNGIF